ncbi:heme ABC transporter substrate-binding protein IsdE [Velocimicrobium porci]|uniref:High-affinity heme uptake system protein IsdE n=1 Tax=Velocimicrobium porci TaxID=2606634 RepID=A0A6L5XYL5_9FIRM|nr:heme ABC transporter substrate-binding protein IsdE [Velocimicrobium porci]MSS63551.1 heme ABC transporter substrate-binding protein IsdE [Velocimicrobium porci]
MKQLKQIFLILLFCAVLFSCSGCVDQTQGKNSKTIIATSVSTAEICEKLNIPLAGVPHSDIYKIPECYKDLPEIGMPMSPDMEVISSMKPDWILSPVSLISDLKPKYDAIDSKYAFLNLNSIPGMYKSIQELGALFDRKEEAEKLVREFENFYVSFQEKNKGKTPPHVLILMGLPGSYVVATEISYVGSLVKMAGGINVYQGEEKDFLSINTEDMLKKDPDIILRTAHALPDEVMEMFSEEFKTNDIWKHFKAVKNKKVYNLSYNQFGMSANFQYQDALEQLESILYPKE